MPLGRHVLETLKRENRTLEGLLLESSLGLGLGLGLGLAALEISSPTALRASLLEQPKRLYRAPCRGASTKSAPKAERAVISLEDG